MRRKLRKDGPNLTITDKRIRLKLCVTSPKEFWRIHGLQSELDKTLELPIDRFDA